MISSIQATMAESGGLGELAASPLLPHATDQILCVHFDTQQEGLWAGTESGVLGQASWGWVLEHCTQSVTLQWSRRHQRPALWMQVACPTLERYSSVPCHEGRVLDLRSVGEGALSVSSTQLCLHASGGVPRMYFRDEVSGQAHLVTLRCTALPAATPPWMIHSVPTGGCCQKCRAGTNRRAKLNVRAAPGRWVT